MPTGKIGPDGAPIYRRVQRSTGVTGRAKAKQIAISYEQAAVAAATRQWQDASAKAFLTELAGITGTAMPHTEPLEAYFRRWLTARASSLGVAAQMRYDAFLSGFLRHLGPGRSAQVWDVAPLQIATWRDAEQKAGKSAATINKGLMVLGQVFDEAIRQGLCERNPARGLNVKGARRNQQKRQAFTFEQFKALVAAMDPAQHTGGGMSAPMRADWQTFLLVAGYTGGRQQEVAGLTWAQIDLPRNVLTLARGKTADTHWIPLHPALAAHLAKTPKDERHGPVMPLLAARQRRHISNDFRRLILPRIGIDQPFAKSAAPTLGRKLAAYSIHSLRHSLATWLQQAGVEEAMRMRLIGHEDATVNRGYTHAGAAQVAQALALVPSVTP